MSGILQESWLSKVVAGWDSVTKLYAFEEHYLAWILLLQDEILLQGAEYLTSYFSCFSRVILFRNLEWLCILRSANC